MTITENDLTSARRERVLAAVRAGEASDAVKLLRELAPAERRGCFPALRPLRREVADEWSRRSRRVRAALLVAGACCAGGPAEAAQWLGSRALQWWDESAMELLQEVLAEREPAWQGEVARRLAERRESAWDRQQFRYVEGLVRDSGCPVPATDGFVVWWVQDRGWGGRTGTLRERLRADAFLPVLVPRLFEVPGVGGLLDQPWRKDDDWPQVLAALAAEGVLDRAGLIDGSLARLLRGGRPGELRPFLRLLAELGPSRAEQADRVRAYARLLPDASSPVAGHAQEVLRALDDEGRLAPGVLLDATRAVLFRPEKKLVRAQLAWLDAAARRAPDRAGELLRAAADGLGHPESVLQERTLNLIARHLRHVDDPELVAGLRAAAEGLDPALRPRAAELLGGSAAPPDEYADLLPPPPEARPVQPLGSAAEVAEEVAAVLAAPSDVPSFERALDGLLRFAHADRAALVASVLPVADARRRAGAGRPGDGTGWQHWGDATPADLAFVVLALLGRLKPALLDAGNAGAQWGIGGAFPQQWLSGFGRLLAARLLEAGRQAAGGAPPCLLALPTESTGTLDPLALAERLRRYQEAGAVPGPVDFGQALLRVRADAGTPHHAAALALADSLTLPQGAELATWLRAGGLRPRATAHLEHDGGPARFPEVRVERVVPPVPLAEPVTKVLELSQYHHQGFFTDGPAIPGAHRAAVLPVNRELVAVRQQAVLFAAARHGERLRSDLLPALAAAEGPAGLAVHLGTAYGLFCRHAEDRATTVDALLLLAAQGSLDGGLLGRELAGLAPRLPLARLTESLRMAARTGAPGTVWTVLAGLLDALPTDAPAPRGLADLLALATDCVLRGGAHGEPPAFVTALADTGSGRPAKEARTLRAALAGGTD